MYRKKQSIRPPAPDFCRQLLPWFPAHSFTSALFPPGYVLDCLQVDPHHAAELCGVSTPTVRRWLRAEPPRWFIPYLLACCGFLLADGWHGWRVTGERLHQPNTRRHSLFYQGFTQADFRALEFTRLNYASTAAKMRDLVHENARLTAQLHRPRVRQRTPASNVVQFATYQKKAL